MCSRTLYKNNRMYLKVLLVTLWALQMEITPPFRGMATLKQSVQGFFFLRQTRLVCRSYEANDVLPVPWYFDSLSQYYKWYTEVLSDDIWKNESQIINMAELRAWERSWYMARQIKSLVVEESRNSLVFWFKSSRPVCWAASAGSLDAEALSPCALHYLSCGSKSNKTVATTDFCLVTTTNPQMERNKTVCTCVKPLPAFQTFLLTHGAQSFGPYPKLNV